MLNPDVGSGSSSSPRKRRRKPRNAAPTQSAPFTFVAEGSQNASSVPDRTYWRTTGRAESRQLDRLAKRVGNPYVMGEFLETLNFQKSQGLLSRYKDQLFETDTSGGGRPEYDMPSVAELEPLANKMKNPEVMARFMSNLRYNKVAGNTAWENDRLFEGDDNHDSPSQLSGGRLVGNDEGIKKYENKPGYEVQKGKDINVVLDRTHSLEKVQAEYEGRPGKNVLGDNKPYKGKVPAAVLSELSDEVKSEVSDGVTMKQAEDGKYYVQQYNKDRDEDEYIPVAAFYEDLKKRSGVKLEDNNPSVDWLGKVVGAAGDAAKTGVGAGLSALDAVTPDVLEEGLKHQAKTAGGLVVDAFHFIERPLYTVNEAQKYEAEHTDSEGKYTGTTKGMLKAIKDGASGKKHTLYSDVLKAKAENDGERNVLDSPWAQMMGGALQDAGGDPINFVGAGVIKGPQAAVRGLNQSRKAIIEGQKAAELRKTVEATARTRIPKSLFDDNADVMAQIESFGSEGRYLTADELYDIVGGNHKTFATSREQKTSVEQGMYVFDKLKTHAGNVEPTRRTKQYFKQQEALEKAAKALEEQRKTVATATQTDVFVNDMIDEAVRMGDTAPDSFKNIMDDITLSEVERAVTNERQRRMYLDSLEDVLDDAGQVVGKKSRYYKPSEEFPTIDDWLASHKSLDDTLGEPWTKNSHLQATEREDIYGTVDKELRKGNSPLSPKFNEEYQLAKAVDDEYKLAKERYDTAVRRNAAGTQITPEDTVNALKADRDAAYVKRNLHYGNLDKMRAKGVVAHANEAVRARLEGRSYIPLDRKRADDLAEVRKELENRLVPSKSDSSLAEPPKKQGKVGSEIKDNKAFPSETEKVMSDADRSAGAVGDYADDYEVDLSRYDLSTVEGRDALFMPDDSFFNYEAQLKGIAKALKKAEKDNTSALGGLDFTKLEAPAVFKTEDGETNIDLIKNYLDYDADKQRFYVHRKSNKEGQPVGQVLGREFNAEELQFLDDLNAHMNTEITSEYGRLVAKAKRPFLEEQAKAAKSKANVTRFQEALQKPPRGASKRVWAKHKAAVHLRDRGMMIIGDKRNEWVIRHNNKKVVVPDPRSTFKLNDILKENGITITDSDKAISKTYIDSIKSIRSGTVTTETGLMPKLINTLQDLGFAPPTDVKLFPAWLEMQTEASLTNALAPERITFARKFRETHNTRMSSAYNAYDRVIDQHNSHVKYVDEKYEKSTWGQLHENGLTEREFWGEASGDADTIRKLMYGMPIQFRLDPAFKGARTKDFAILKNHLTGYANGHKNAGTKTYVEASKEWVNTLIKLKKEYPAQYVRMMNDGWRSHMVAASKRRVSVRTEIPETVRTRGKGSKRTTGVRTITTHKRDLNPMWDSDNWGKNVDEINRQKQIDEQARLDTKYDFNDKIDFPALKHEAAANVWNRTFSDISIAKRIPTAKVPKSILGGKDYVDVERRVTANLKAELKEKKVALEAERAEAKTPDEIASIDRQIADLKTQWHENRAKINKSRSRSLQARQKQYHTLREQSLLQLVEAGIVPERGGIGFNFAGKTALLRVPSADILGQGAARRASDWIVEASHKMYAKTIEAPVASLKSELQVQYHRGSVQPDQIIRIRTDMLNKNLGIWHKSDRKKMFGGYRDRVPYSPVSEHAAPLEFIQQEFDSMVPMFQNRYKVNGSALSYQEIARYLPKALQLENRAFRRTEYFSGTPEYGFDIAYMFDKFAKYPSEAKKIVEDPLDLLWNLRVATEKALGYKYMSENINKMYGVKRIEYLTVQSGKKKKRVKAGTPEEKERSQLIEHFKDLGWQTIPRLDNPNYAFMRVKPEGTHYFPPEIVPEINKLLDLLEPRNLDRFGVFADKLIAKFKMETSLGAVGDFGSKGIKGAAWGADKTMRGVDRTTRGWKAAATVPNPGFYTRNLLGEFMAGWFGGVQDARYYESARKLLHYMNGDAKELEAIMHSQPWAAHIANKMPGSGETVVMTRAGGLTMEDAAIMYYDQVLKTGFLNTERHAALEGLGIGTGRVASSPVGQAYKAMRNFGEKVEDWPRIAHFLHALENAPAKLTKFDDIAEYAAGEVRKYHFDYADVSQFEKTMMVRLFPFYKWTRKSIPLMSSMLFLKPGKMAAVPKVMTFGSDMTSHDFITDGHPNGYMPQYDNMVPDFIKDIWSYKGPRDSEGRDTYFNIQTPQTDILKVLANPARGATGLLNPLIKVPLELGTGETVDLSSGQGYPVGDSKRDILSEFLRQTPTTNFLDKVSKSYETEPATGGQGTDGQYDPDQVRYDEYGNVIKKKRRADNALFEKGNVTKNPLSWLSRFDETTISWLTGGGLYENFNKSTEPHDPSQPTVVD